MRTVGIIQARMTSARFPGKIIAPVDGQPLLALLVKRMQRCRELDQVVVATTTNREDDVTAFWAESLGISCLRGDEVDVFDRYLTVLENYSCESFVRITADNPVTDPELVDEMVRHFHTCRADYCNGPGLPPGAAGDVFRSGRFLAAGMQELTAYEREHINAFFLNRPQEFTLATYSAQPALGKEKLSITIDLPEQLAALNHYLSEKKLRAIDSRARDFCSP